MSKTVIKVANLSKLYRLGEVGTGTVGHDLNRWWAKMRGKEDPFAKVGQTNDRATKAEKGEHVWALQDINFEVKQGEILGIIGKNGAGKSTLLKLLSRITSPTKGSIKTKGRIASLLEVGTGFHPEMTGRENVYLNGTILGMTRREIDAKFEEIMDFAGCLKYADTPVKRYSSGMKVRLGFAVAAFLEPEILIVDEVLAVGDAEFQKKAIGKMQDISSGGGRTVLFVSHNMGSVRNLCSQSILLEEGKVSRVGITNEVINYYLHSDFKHYKNLSEVLDRKGSGAAVFTDVKYYDCAGNLKGVVATGDDLGINVCYKLKQNICLRNCRISIAFKKGDKVFIILSTEQKKYSFDIDTDGSINFLIPKLPLTKGEYRLTLFMESSTEIIDWLSDAVSMNVEDGDYYKSGKDYPRGWEGKTVLVDYNVVR